MQMPPRRHLRPRRPRRDRDRGERVMSARFKLQIVRNKQRPQVGALLVLVGERDIAKSKPNEVGLIWKGGAAE